MNEEIRFCKDCIHFQEGLLCHFCTSPELPAEPIYGNKILTADASRGLQAFCGREGRFFEKKQIVDTRVVLVPERKPSLWERVVKFVKGEWA